MPKKVTFAQNMNTSTKKILFLDKSWPKLVEFFSCLLANLSSNLLEFGQKKSNLTKFDIKIWAMKLEKSKFEWNRTNSSQLITNTSILSDCIKGFSVSCAWNIINFFHNTAFHRFEIFNFFLKNKISNLKTLLKSNPYWSCYLNQRV